MSKLNVHDVKFVYPSPYKYPYFKEGKAHRDLIPFVDMRNTLHLVSTKNT